MESVVDEFVFIVGPVLVTFLSTTGHATSGVVTAFTLAAVGSLLFAAQGRTEPPPAPHEHRNGPSAMRIRGLRVLFVVGAAVGAILGTPGDRAGRLRRPGGRQVAVRRPDRRAGASGSMASGIGWGTVHWRHPAAAPAGGGAGADDPAAASRCCWSHDVWLMVPFVVLAGVAVSPSLISSFTLAEVLVPRAAVTEAFTWIGTALGLGRGGRRLGRRARSSTSAGANAAFLVATVAAGVAAVVVAAVPAAAARAGRARLGPGAGPLMAAGRRPHASTSCSSRCAPGSTASSRPRPRAGWPPARCWSTPGPSSSATGTARCPARSSSTATSWSGGWTRPARTASPR